MSSAVRGISPLAPAAQGPRETMDLARSACWQMRLLPYASPKKHNVLAEGPAHYAYIDRRLCGIRRSSSGDGGARARVGHRKPATNPEDPHLRLELELRPVQ